MTDYTSLESRITAWAAAHPNLVAGVVVGSRGRSDHPADQWSDLDLVIFADEPGKFIQDGTWLEGFGPLWASWLDDTGAGYPEWFALYAGGLKVDIVFVPVQAGDETLADMLRSFAHQDVLQRGVRVLFDKTSLASPAGVPLPDTGNQPHSPLSPDKFRAGLSQFWITATKTAKLIQRGDLWRAKQACDSELKACLLTMLEWHARSIYGHQRDIWYDGRFLSNWADPRAVAELPSTYAAYDQADLRRALLATLRLYHRLATETAASLGCGYPRPNDLQVLDWITTTLAA
jgi:aminoglycoside 6-adenylyltransferase